MLGGLKLRERKSNESRKQQRAIVQGRRIFKDLCDRFLQKVWKGEETEGGRDRGCSAQSSWQTFTDAGWSDKDVDWSVVEVRREKEQLCAREKLSCSSDKLMKGRGDRDGSSVLYFDNEACRWDRDTRSRIWELSARRKLLEHRRWRFQCRKSSLILEAIPKFRRWQKKNQWLSQIMMNLKAGWKAGIVQA